jgi:GntR family transcriptional regulator
MSVTLKHERVAAELEKEIRSGRVPRGARLPGEVALARRFGVSRNTVRAALAELNQAGLIATRTGKGSFVLFDGRPLDARPGWARAQVAHGVETRVRVLGITATREDELAARLGLGSPELIAVERVREIAPGSAISYERSCVPAVEGLDDLPARGLEGGSLADALTRAGLHVDHGEQKLFGRRIGDHEAALLRREPGEWFLGLERTSWTAGGRFVEHARSLLDPGHFQLCLDFRTGDA